MPSTGLRWLTIGWTLSFLLVAGGCGGGGPQRRGESMIVMRGGDLVGTGNTVRVSDSVPGDVMLTAGEIGFTGTAGGDYLGAGGDQTVAGTIIGSARVAGGNVEVAARIGRNATIAGGNVEIERNASIGGNAYLAGGSVEVEGTVTGLLRATGGSVRIDGAVGDVNLSAGSLVVGPRARIDGDLRYRVPPDQVRIDPAATITGQTIALPVRRGLKFWTMLRLLWAAGFLFAGVVLIALLPSAARAASDGVRARPGVAIGLGVLWVFLLPVVLGLIGATVIGIPLALILFGAYLIVLYLAGIVLALALGRLALREAAGTGRGRLIAAFLLGAIVLILLSMIPVVGGLLVLLALLLGTGSMLVPLVRRRTG